MTGLLAVGRQTGLYPDDPVDGVSSAYVQLGVRLERLPEQRYLVWRAAHGAPDHPEGAPWTAGDVAAVAARSGVPASAVPAELAELTGRGLVTGLDDVAAFARRHTVVPLAVGLGNSAADPGGFRYALGGQVLATLPRTLYQLVALAHRWPHLDAACRALARQAATAGVPLDAARDPERLLAWLVGALPRLCSLHVVHLAPAAAS